LASFAFKINKTTYTTQGVELKVDLIRLKRETKLKIGTIIHMCNWKLLE
jgi:hypothetical protein